MSGVEEPLLLPRANSSTVTCNGVKGTLSIDKDGGISYKPLEVWCKSCPDAGPTDCCLLLVVANPNPICSAADTYCDLVFPL